jgi:hypothetical protein
MKTSANYTVMLIPILSLNEPGNSSCLDHGSSELEWTFSALLIAQLAGV